MTLTRAFTTFTARNLELATMFRLAGFHRRNTDEAVSTIVYHKKQSQARIMMISPQ